MYGNGLRLCYVSVLRDWILTWIVDQQVISYISWYIHAHGAVNSFRQVFANYVDTLLFNGLLLFASVLQIELKII